MNLAFIRYFDIIINIMFYLAIVFLLRLFLVFIYTHVFDSLGVLFSLWSVVSIFVWGEQ